MTTMMDLDEALARVRAARSPAQLFGADDDGARVYRTLARIIHPDRVPADRVAEATAAFARLATLWSSVRRRVIVSPTATYQVGVRAGHDEVADYLVGRQSDMDVLLKVAHRPIDNDLLEREAELLGRVWSGIEPKHRAYLPALRESFTYRDTASGADRTVNVFDHAPGLVSLAAVGAAYPVGLDARDVAWMWRRLLVALGLAHRAGVVHGAVLPDHVLIEPAEHGLVLANWCYAADGPWPLVPALVRRYRDWYAPEIVTRHRATEGSDIYLATRCMVALMGDRAPAPLARFARGCLRPSPAARPDDAWLLLAELDDVLGHLYGPRRFRTFAVPATVPTWPQPVR